jgi:CDP-paratose 2-epimerase
MRLKAPALIIGGAGFIGTNLADRLMSQGTPVMVFDSLARNGVDENVRWLERKHGSLLEIHVGDVRDRNALRPVIARAAQVFHFAAQVAVTTSLADPVDDFESNALGTLNVLEELRRLKSPPPLAFTSTNKVYGALDDIPLLLQSSRYEPSVSPVKRNGIGESRPLDFHSPYGCSKGTADQYVLDYARSFGLRTVVFRMSCIYGPHQCGNEDQGWVAHFLIQALKKRPITIFGDGMQVRDILYVEDLVDAFQAAISNIDEISGEAFNMGGGPSNAISLNELLNLIGELDGSMPDVSFADWRVGDQRYYVSDTSKFQRATGWAPKYSATEGIRSLYEWLTSTESTIEKRAAVVL